MKKNIILFLTMNLLLTNSIDAQGPLSMERTTNWLGAIHATLGNNSPAGWFLDLNADDMETYVASNHALVIVDRSPIAHRNGEAYFRSPMNELCGTRLSLIGDVEYITGSVMHGVYSGLLGGTAVMMDQYVRMRNCVPITIVRVITRVNGSAPQINFDQEELVKELMDGPAQIDAPVQRIDQGPAEGTANSMAD